MKTALIIASNADGSASTVLPVGGSTNPVPYDEARTAFRALVDGKVEVIAGQPNIRLWTEGGVVKRHTLKPKPPEPEPELTEEKKPEGAADPKPAKTDPEPDAEDADGGKKKKS